MIEPVERDALEWGVSARWARAWFVSPLVLAVSVGLLAAPGALRPLYRLIVWEDGIAEWIQVGLIAGIIVLGFVVGKTLFGLGFRRMAALYAIGAIGMVFILGEEISWGQRIFGWATPEALDAINQQGETNLHNIWEVLKILNVIMLAIALVACALPIVWRSWAGSRSRYLLEALLVPPLFTVPCFAIVAFYRTVRIVLLPEAPAAISRYQELVELFFYAGVLAFVWVVNRRVRAQAAAEAGADARRTVA